MLAQGSGRQAVRADAVQRGMKPSDVSTVR